MSVRNFGCSEASFYIWKKRYGNLGLSEVKELRQLRDENTRLKISLNTRASLARSRSPPVMVAVRPRDSSSRRSMVILETERLTLRHFELGDLDALHRLYRDPQIRAHFPEGTRTFAETKEELEWFLHGHPNRPELGLWATVERSTGAFLGRCGLLPWTIDGQAEVELAYLMDKSRWGEGLYGFG